MNIFKQTLPPDQYFQELFPKTQIYLHHTAGNSNPHGVVTDWATDERGKIATSYVIGGAVAPNTPYDGLIVEAFDPKFWAWHLGIKTSGFPAKIVYRTLDKISIGIELCSWGPLILGDDGRWHTYVNTIVDEKYVAIPETPFKGFKAFHRYTEKQIDSLRQVLIYLNSQFGIPIKYNPDIFGLTDRAFNSEPGLYTHNSVRQDKTDIFPQRELIEMLKSL